MLTPKQIHDKWNKEERAKLISLRLMDEVVKVTTDQMNERSDTEFPDGLTLSNAFFWNKSEKGFKYWSSIDDNLDEMESVPIFTFKI